MNSILYWITHLFGVGTVESTIEELAIESLAAQGHDALVRAATLPQAAVNQISAKFNTDPAKVEEANIAHANAFAEFALIATDPNHVPTP